MWKLLLYFQPDSMAVQKALDVDQDKMLIKCNFDMGLLKLGPTVFESEDGQYLPNKGIVPFRHYVQIS